MFLSLTLALLALVAPGGESGSATPEETVRRYLGALQVGDFQAAYPLISAAMAQDKTREQWIAEQRWATQTCDVAILAFQVFPGTVSEQTARVPTRVRSRDAFADGREVEEHELYTLARDAGTWRITKQRIVEPAERPPGFQPPRSPQRRHRQHPA